MNIIYCKYNINAIFTFISKKKTPDMDTKERTIRWERVYDPLRVAERIRNLSLEKLQERESGVGCCIARAFRINPKNSGIKCIFLFFSVNIFFSQMIGNRVGKNQLKVKLRIPVSSNSSKLF